MKYLKDIGVSKNDQSRLHSLDVLSVAVACVRRDAGPTIASTVVIILTIQLVVTSEPTLTRRLRARLEEACNSLNRVYQKLIRTIDRKTMI